jgi:hypothetical protein
MPELFAPGTQTSSGAVDLYWIRGMAGMSTTGDRRRLELAVAYMSAATAINAFGGATYGWRGAPGVPLEWLRGSPFEDYRVPSAMLGAGVGGTSAVSAVMAWRGSERAAGAALLAGSVLTGWIVAQVAVIGFRSVLQPTMAGVGVSLIGLGRRLQDEQRRLGAAAAGEGQRTREGVMAVRMARMTSPPSMEAPAGGTPWLGGVLCALATALAAVSLLGPLVSGVIEWRITPTILSQLYGLDAVSLGLVAPLALVAGVLSLRGSSLGAVLGLGPAVYAMYMVPQYVLGPDYLRLPGNNERWFPLLLLVFVLGLVAACLAWHTLRLSRRLPRIGWSAWPGDGCCPPRRCSSSSATPPAWRIG